MTSKPKVAATIEVQFPGCARKIRVTFDKSADKFTPTPEAMVNHFRGTPWVLCINSKDYNVSSVTERGIVATPYPGDTPTKAEEIACRALEYTFKWAGIWEIHVY